MRYSDCLRERDGGRDGGRDDGRGARAGEVGVGREESEFVDAVGGWENEKAVSSFGGRVRSFARAIRSSSFSTKLVSPSAAGGGRKVEAGEG